jgi:tRNA A37 threonylcarbamoyladenosine modification protein TsaB
VDSLQIMAATVPFYPARIKVIQNAYKGEFYTATYSTREGRAKCIDSLNLIHPDVFYAQLAADDLLLGTGVSLLLTKGYDLAAKKVRWNQDFHRTVSGIAVTEYFLDHEAREPSLKPLEPIYIRLPEAEINYRKLFGPAE